MIASASGTNGSIATTPPLISTTTEGMERLRHRERTCKRKKGYGRLLGLSGVLGVFWVSQGNWGYRLGLLEVSGIIVVIGFSEVSGVITVFLEILGLIGLLG